MVPVLDIDTDPSEITSRAEVLKDKDGNIGIAESTRL